MPAGCKNCAYGHKAQHSACDAQCASGQAPSRNNVCSLYNYTLIIMFRGLFNYIKRLGDHMHNFSFCANVDDCS